MLCAEEIGVPYVDPRKAVAQSATLSPDGETFYTYANNTLTHWSLNPIRKLKTIIIDKEKDFSQSLIKFSFLSNKRLLLFATNEKLATFDVQTNTFLQVLDINASLVDTLFDNILLIERNGKSKILSPNNLKSIIEGELSLYYKIHNTNLKSIHLLVKNDDQETFKIKLDNRSMIVNSNTLIPISEFVSEGYSPVSIQKSHLSMVKLAQEGAWRQKKGKGNQSLNKIWRTFSSTNNFLFFDEIGDDFYVLYDKQTQKKLFTYSYFQNDNWLIITPDGYFDGSPESRQYLYMKTSSGESVPIDDATYNKYHKPIYLNDLTKDK
jgi:hypothetical protein